MPVTHGVTGSSPVRTARNLPLLIGVAGDFLLPIQNFVHINCNSFPVFDEVRAISPFLVETINGLFNG